MADGGFSSAGIGSSGSASFGFGGFGAGAAAAPTGIGAGGIGSGLSVFGPSGPALGGGTGSALPASNFEAYLASAAPKPFNFEASTSPLPAPGGTTLPPVFVAPPNGTGVGLGSIGSSGLSSFGASGPVGSSGASGWARFDELVGQRGAVLDRIGSENQALVAQPFQAPALPPQYEPPKPPAFTAQPLNPFALNAPGVPNLPLPAPAAPAPAAVSPPPPISTGPDAPPLSPDARASEVTSPKIDAPRSGLFDWLNPLGAAQAAGPGAIEAPAPADPGGSTLPPVFVDPPGTKSAAGVAALPAAGALAEGGMGARGIDAARAGAEWLGGKLPSAAGALRYANPVGAFGAAFFGNMGSIPDQATEDRWLQEAKQRGANPFTAVPPPGPNPGLVPPDPLPENPGLVPPAPLPPMPGTTPLGPEYTGPQIMENRILPTGPLNGVPEGVRRANPENAAPLTKHEVQREQEANDRLAAAGYHVVQQPTLGPNPALTRERMAELGLDPRKNPDQLVEGRVFDIYTPETDNVRSIRGKIAEKIGTRQADHITLNLADTPVTAAEVRAAIQQHPVPGLKEVIIIDQNGVLGSIRPFQGDPLAR